MGKALYWLGASTSGLVLVVIMRHSEEARERLGSVWDLVVKHLKKALGLTWGGVLKKEPPISISQTLVERARAQFVATNDCRCIFAIIGAAGVGKSSFANAIRFFDDTHEDGANVEEAETKPITKVLPHPLWKNTVLCDFPGAGTHEHPYGTYFTDLKLYAFHCILILTSGGFLQGDYDLAKSALAYGIKCAFVHTKSDLGVKSIVEREGVSSLEAMRRLREHVHKSFIEGLEDCGLSWAKSSLPLFLISSRAFTKKDAYAFEPNKINDSQKVDKLDELQNVDKKDYSQKVDNMDELQIVNAIDESQKSNNMDEGKLEEFMDLIAKSLSI